MREYLKVLREKHKLSQQQIADRLDMSQQYYGFIENGERQKRLDLEIAAKLSTIFDISLDKIMEEERKCLR